ncbi:MAG: B12-binding domain-containing radical SAM protein [Lachnospiraceae bacterium]|nr:B12-binding domain-containing radical SAM protein [Lachnospiraceae bacterium]
MRIIMITPASALRRFPPYRLAGKAYGQSNSITGPLILGGILKKAGHEVEAYEELNGSVPFKHLKDADVVCLYTLTCSAPRAYELAEWFHANTHARVLIGGIHASALPEEAARYADQVIVGEGESVILDVVEGRIRDKIVNAPCPEDLDRIPFPDYSILKTPCRSANVMSTRGCPFCCSFCTTSRMFHPYRQRSVDSVIEELRYYKKLGFRYMNFEDDNFTADRERAKEICRRMIREGLTFKETFFFGRTDLAKDEEMLDLLREAHLTRVLVGIESLNQKSLDAVNKHQSVDDIKKCTAILAKHGIRLIASIVLGIDTDTKEDIIHSVDFVKSCNAYQLQPAILTPYPGTDTYRQMAAENRMITTDWTMFDMMDVTFLPKSMSPWELQNLFYSMGIHFYDFKSIPAIWKAFGPEYGMRRFALAILFRLGVVAARGASHNWKSTQMYKLRHYSRQAGNHLSRKEEIA